MIADRVQKVEASKTLSFMPLLQKLKNKGEDIIDFVAGELDFETPDEVVAATKQALDEHKTKYSAVTGIGALKQAIISNLQRNDLEYDEDNILVTNGAKQALYNIFQTICNPGDEVILPSPYWVSFSEQIKLASAAPVIVPTKDLQLDIEAIQQSVSNKTKAIIVNSPNNPAGAVYPKKDLRALVDLAVDHDLTIISDEAYEMMVYDGLQHCSIASLSEESKQRTVVVKSLSKSYSMTGFRIGYVAAAPELITAISKVQGHSTGNVCTFAQYGAVAALALNEKFLMQRRSILEKRRNLAYGLASKLFPCTKPQGAFYLFPQIGETANDFNGSSEAFAAHLLKKAKVATVPGSAFGAEGHIRISYAVGEDTIKKGFERISQAL